MSDEFKAKDKLELISEDFQGTFDAAYENSRQLYLLELAARDIGYTFGISEEINMLKTAFESIVDKLNKHGAVIYEGNEGPVESEGKDDN